MLKSRPLFLIVVTLCLTFVVVASYWVALMPQRTLRNLQAEMLDASGNVLEAKRARLDVTNGFGVILEDVSITNPAVPAWQFSAKSVAIPGIVSGSVVLDHAVVDIDVTSVYATGIGLPDHITFRDGILKLRDPARQAVIAVTDINGDISADGAKGMQGQLAMVWGSQVSDLTFNIEDLERFTASGSPMDLTLKSKAQVFGFSGQGRAEKGLALVGQATAEANDIGSFFRWLGMPVQSLDGAGAASLQSGLTSNGLSLSFSTLTGDIGGSKVKGVLTLAAGADRSKFSGTLNLSSLSLWGPNTQTSMLSQAWPEAPLPIADVVAVDLDIAATLDQLNLRQRELGAVSVQLKSSAGHISVVMPEQKFAGGTGRINLSFARAGGSLQMATAIDLRSVSAQSLLGGLLGSSSLDGPVNLNADVKAEGQSVAAMVSSLAGQMKLSSRDAKVLKVDLLPPLSKVQKGWQQQDALSTEKFTFDIGMSIAEGVAALNSSTASFDGIALKPGGEIDLLRQAVAVQLAPKGKTSDPKMSMKGPWLSPEFSTANTPKENAAATPPAN